MHRIFQIIRVAFCLTLALYVAAPAFAQPRARATPRKSTAKTKPAAPQSDLKPIVRGLATRAPAGMKIDGDLSEFANAFCTPIGYFAANVNSNNADQYKNRAAQFFYMWDDEAFYAALRTMDETPANLADDKSIWMGDGVEWYFDTRRDNTFRNKEWGKGSLHMYWAGLDKTDIRGRYCFRPKMLDMIPGEGIEVGARRTDFGVEVEFKLPWKNFPNYTKPKVNDVIGVDAELCYSDGGTRVARAFAYGNPLSVQQPSSQAPVQLVEKFLPAYWAQCAPVMAPVRCDIPWGQPTEAQVTGYMALPPNQLDTIGKVVFRLLDTNGAKIADAAGEIETLNAAGKFARAKAQWNAESPAPGSYSLVGILYDKLGKELGRATPRMVSDGITPGY